MGPKVKKQLPQLSQEVNKRYPRGTRWDSSQVPTEGSPGPAAWLMVFPHLVRSHLQLAPTQVGHPPFLKRVHLFLTAPHLAKLFLPPGTLFSCFACFILS